jgi:hypothetical protein
MIVWMKVPATLIYVDIYNIEEGKFPLRNLRFLMELENQLRDKNNSKQNMVSKSGFYSALSAFFSLCST